MRADNPITKADDDRLRRQDTASSLAAQLRGLDASAGCVVAVMGQWGSGKTSLINLLRERLTEPPVMDVIDFNPWMFSGAEQLVNSFFVELAAQLKDRPGKLGRIGTEIEAYGDLLSPLSLIPYVGTLLGKVKESGAAMRRFEERRSGGVTGKRKRLFEQLGELDQPILVVLDDIDRLTDGEIREIFKLVRLTANFPQIIYLLAFDRKRVERALDQTGTDGRAYLEKIIQVALDVPALPASVLRRQFVDELNGALGEIDGRHFHEDVWMDVFEEIIWPLIGTMRDARRYISSAVGTVRALDVQVATVDVLGMEAVRIFLPDVFTAITQQRVLLTRAFDPHEYVSSHRRNPAATAVQSIVEVDLEHRTVTCAVLRRLLPAAAHFLDATDGGGTRYGPEWHSKWLRERRVGHADVLALYLERHSTEGITAFIDAEQAYAMLTDGPRLDAFLRSLPPERTQDVIDALGHYHSEFTPEMAVPACTVLLNLLPTLPNRQHQGLLFVATGRVVTRVVLMLIRTVKGSEAVLPIVREVLPALDAVTPKIELIRLISQYSGHEDWLIPDEAVASLEEQIVQEIDRVGMGALAGEPDVLMIWRWYRERRPDGPQITLSPDDRVLAKSVLLSARNQVLSHFEGSRKVHTGQRLDWQTLIESYGGEDALRTALTGLRSGAADAALNDALSLADSYLAGWRPEP